MRWLRQSVSVAYSLNVHNDQRLRKETASSAGRHGLLRAIFVFVLINFSTYEYIILTIQISSAYACIAQYRLALRGNFSQAENTKIKSEWTMVNMRTKHSLGENIRPVYEIWACGSQAIAVLYLHWKMFQNTAFALKQRYIFFVSGPFSLFAVECAMSALRRIQSHFVAK